MHRACFLRSALCFPACSPWTNTAALQGDPTPEEMAVVEVVVRLEVVDVSIGANDRGFDITGQRDWYDHPRASTDMILAVRSDLRPDERGLLPDRVDVLWGIPADHPQRPEELLVQEGLQIRRD